MPPDTLAIDTAFAMDMKLEQVGELAPYQIQYNSEAQYQFLNFHLWDITRNDRTHRLHLYFYGTIERDYIGVKGY